MPELPDIMTYQEALGERIAGHVLEQVRLRTPFLLRSVEPPLSAARGRRVVGVERLGKRLAIALEGDLWLVIHLMIAGRLHWKTRDASIGSKISLAAFDFDSGTLTLTEAGTKRRASLHVAGSRAALAEFDRGGLDIFAGTLKEFAARLATGNHTLKRALTDPRAFDGIGNAFSDEILLEARLSPLKLTLKLEPAEIERLWRACRAVLNTWIDRFREQRKGEFPEKVTAFRPEMAVHGKFGQPCPVCGSPVQRIRYADNETNYCARCQNEGRVLADRALSRLLKEDFPRTLAEAE